MNFFGLHRACGANYNWQVWPLHNAASIKKRVAESFRCFLSLNICHLWYVLVCLNICHSWYVLVWSQVQRQSFKMSPSVIRYWSDFQTVSPKSDPFPLGLLLQRQPKADLHKLTLTKLNHKLSAVKINRFSDIDQLRHKCLNIGHVCV